jgi:UDP-N-acetyl-2-amino-2-deoxyglucuronate dehydrogenase
LNGNGFGLEEVRSSIEIVHEIRLKEPIGLKGNYHPLANLKLAEHPFKNIFK